MKHQSRENTFNLRNFREENFKLWIRDRELQDTVSLG